MTNNSYDYDESVEKLFITALLSDDVLFTKIRTILKPDYFVNRLQPVIKFILDYAEEYKIVPKPEIINAKFKQDFIAVDLKQQEHFYFVDELVKFCRHKDVSNIILSAPGLIEQGRYEDVEQGLKQALLISINTDLGSNFFTDFESSLLAMKTNNGTASTGWKTIDDVLYGGFNRGELNVFLAKSGGGKSLFMQNIALNWAIAGLNVVYFSLELAEALINKRLGSMLTEVNQADIMKNISDVQLKIALKAKGSSGSLLSKQMPQGSTTNDIRAYLKEYEIVHGHPPDAIIVDYLDLMYPNNKKVDPSNLFIKDKFVSEELRGLAIEFKMLLVTASQVNREGMNELEFDFTHIAGGVSKINTSDNVIGILMTEGMRNRQEIQIQFLKTRSSGGVGQKRTMYFNPETLAIKDKEDGDVMSVGSSSSTQSLTSVLRSRATTQPQNQEEDDNDDNSVQPVSAPVANKPNVSLRDKFVKQLK